MVVNRRRRATCSDAVVADTSTVARAGDSIRLAERRYG